MPSRTKQKKRTRHHVLLLRAIRYLLKEHSELIQRPGVIGYGVGYRERHGVVTREPAIRVYVTPGLKQRDHTKLGKAHSIPSEIVFHVGGRTLHVPVDLIEAPIGKPHGGASGYIAPGGTIGNSRSADISGTIGWIARLGDGTAVVCSCYHVLLPFKEYFHTFSSVQIFDSREDPYEEAMHPSRNHNGKPSTDVIGRVLYGRRSSTIDIAVCAVDTPAELIDSVEEIGTMGPPAKISENSEDVGPGDRVILCGGESRKLEGEVTDLDLAYPMAYPDGTITMTDLISTTIPTRPGDSGSLLLTSKRNPVGMLLGVAGDRSLYCRIDNIIQEMELKTY
ncbi:MAG: hypothetical protein WAU88_01570 [Candidatus Zixiibacteriota bacterium]